MYSVIKQNKQSGIEIKCVTLKLPDAKRLALHYLKKELDEDLEKGYDVKIADINEANSKTVFAEYCLTYTELPIDSNTSIYTVVAMPPIISSTNVEELNPMHIMQGN